MTRGTFLVVLGCPSNGTAQRDVVKGTWSLPYCVCFDFSARFRPIIFPAHGQAKLSSQYDFRDTKYPSALGWPVSRLAFFRFVRVRRHGDNARGAIAMAPPAAWQTAITLRTKNDLSTWSQRIVSNII